MKFAFSRNTLDERPSENWLPFDSLSAKFFAKPTDRKPGQAIGRLTTQFRGCQSRFVNLPCVYNPILFDAPFVVPPLGGIAADMYNFLRLPPAIPPKGGTTNKPRRAGSRTRMR